MPATTFPWGPVGCLAVSTGTAPVVLRVMYAVGWGSGYNGLAVAP
jgi:hypothetical protein